MKKAIVSAAIALGLAASASAEDLSTADYTYTLTDIGTTTGLKTFSSDDSSTEDVTESYSSLSGSRVVMSATVVCDYSSLLTYTPNNFLVLTPTSGYTWGLRVTTDGYLYGMWNRATSGSVYLDLNSLDVNTETDQITFTAVTSNSGTDIYYAYYDSTGTLKEGSFNVSGLCTSSVTYTSLGVYAPIVTAAYEWSTNLSSADAAAVTTSALTVYTPAAVPEPATATLSLLALAGLAARRRRK